MIRKTFVMTDRVSSTVPRKYPAVMPMTVPTIVVNNPTRKPICNVNLRAPNRLLARHPDPDRSFRTSTRWKGLMRPATKSVGSPGEIRRRQDRELQRDAPESTRPRSAFSLWKSGLHPRRGRMSRPPTRRGLSRFGKRFPARGYCLDSSSWICVSIATNLPHVSRFAPADRAAYTANRRSDSPTSTASVIIRKMPCISG